MRTAPSAGRSRILGLGGFTNYLKSGDNHAFYGKFHSGLDSDQPADPCAGPADAGPVSYTHLDVYKRQFLS